MLKSVEGYFGEFGGNFLPEILQETIAQVAKIYEETRDDPLFWQEYLDLIHSYSARPTPLTYAKNLTEQLGGANIYIKREDLNHTGAHKINNVMGQGLLAKRMGKKRVIAETGAGQHGVATATMAAKLGLECTIYMGAVDVERQYPNVFWMRKLGADVVAVHSGTKTLKDSINQAMRDWSESMNDTHYVLGTACGPYPFPELVSWFQSIISHEIKEQFFELKQSLPDAVYACVGGGSNALGAFGAFVENSEVALIGVEAGGKGLDTGMHATRIASNQSKVGISQGYKTFFLQTDEGQMKHTHSISAGLDYVGVSPIIADLADKGRVKMAAATDVEVIDALKLCIKKEGIIPALESSHAFAAAFADIGNYNSDQNIVINLSGRGDKDIFTIAEALDDEDWKKFIISKAKSFQEEKA